MAASSLSSWLPWGTSSTPPPPPPRATDPTPPPPSPSSAPQQHDSPASPEPMSQTKRMLRQLSLPLFGSAFLLLTLRLTRRSTARRIKATIPPYYHPNNQAPTNPPSGALDAVEALQLATLNVFSFAMLLVGGGAFAMDVSSLEELRAKFKASEMGEEWEGQNKAAEEEWEEWAVSVLARKELKDRAKAEAEKELEKKN
ncbi:hypothetical protein K440DRAFT_664224 [Wilcoxina mikolae CBS 423.85]|nr:hypothetical protein K440DRAFT_664224 [Wilcoxina mikolae CBS 423.85]